MRQYRVVRDAFSRLRPVASAAGSEGLSVATLIGEQDGSSHVEISVVELAPGGWVDGHLHPFEESFFLLSGRAVLSIDDAAYALEANDFGFVPVASAHAWRNTSTVPARWYRIRSPQPRPLGRADGTFPVVDHAVPDGGRAIAELHPRSRYVGRFSDEDLPGPGPLTMPGAHGHNIRDIAVRMMIDDVLGAVHHQLFMVQFAPSEELGFSGSAHYHDFEEAYFVLSGRGEVELEGERFEVGPGDLVWESAGTMHAWTARGEQPLRFIELMAPRPPYTNMLFSERTWRELADETLGPAGD
jgi:mannose-6-phosphate isomerase-like protein (cupin superfamily)